MIFRFHGITEKKNVDANIICGDGGVYSFFWQATKNN